MSFLKQILNQRHKTCKGYSRLPTTGENVDTWKKKYSNLSHVKTGREFHGTLLIDGEEFVAVLQCNITTGYIVALEVAPAYQRQGIAKALLSLARNEFHCHLLTVRESNKTAVDLYLKEGYKIFKQEGIMYHMHR